MNIRVILTTFVFVFSLSISGADELPAWQESFDAICAGTTNAMAMTIPELESLLEQCDVISTKIVELDATRAKIYRKRLDLACNLYRFVLSEKKASVAGIEPQ